VLGAGALVLTVLTVLPVTELIHSVEALGPVQSDGE
jgi:hypothetical protein